MLRGVKGGWAGGRERVEGKGELQVSYLQGGVLWWGLGGGGVAVSQGRCVCVRVWLRVHGEKAICGSRRAGSKMGLSAGVCLPGTEGMPPNLAGSTRPLPSSRQSVSPRSPLLTPAAVLPRRRHAPPGLLAHHSPVVLLLPSLLSDNSHHVWPASI